MLFCAMAAKAPSTMDAMEMKTMICCQASTRSWKGPISTRVKSAMAAIFGATAKKAVTEVGAPS